MIFLLFNPSVDMILVVSSEDFKREPIIMQYFDAGLNQTQPLALDFVVQQIDMK